MMNYEEIIHEILATKEQTKYHWYSYSFEIYIKKKVGLELVGVDACYQRLSEGELLDLKHVKALREGIRKLGGLSESAIVHVVNNHYLGYMTKSDFYGCRCSDDFEPGKSGWCIHFDGKLSMHLEEDK
ncbi:hypothetical protein [Shewanella algae]|uniref:hypothetical protein n=1 Tax=Shewanella algae TaxID=38313 RepID=UPI001AAE8110|nr:hypothetical protein [Shewanella algae]MBO2582507.1 hypothetical protein [Shewanella algae]